MILILFFLFIFMSKKLSNIRKSVLFSIEFIYNVFEDEVTVSFLLHHNVK